MPLSSSNFNTAIATLKGTSTDMVCALQSSSISLRISSLSFDFSWACVWVREVGEGLGMRLGSNYGSYSRLVSLETSLDTKETKTVQLD